MVKILIRTEEGWCWALALCPKGVLVGNSEEGYEVRQLTREDLIGVPGIAEADPDCPTLVVTALGALATQASTQAAITSLVNDLNDLKAKLRASGALAEEEE